MFFLIFKSILFKNKIKSFVINIWQYKKMNNLQKQNK